jgi:hypothetical protein
MAQDLSELLGDETELHPRSKRLSFAGIGHDSTSSLTVSPITAPTRSTPPLTVLALDRPMLDSFMTPPPQGTSSPGMAASRQFPSLDHDIAKFAQTVPSHPLALTSLAPC